MTRPVAARLGSYAVIFAAAFLATLPLLLHGASCGHDFPFHLLNWMDAAHQWRSGILRPWWCAAAAWNTGEARFLFYPPLSWLLGGLLTLLLGVSHAPAVYTFVSLAACGATMRRFLVQYVSAPLALLGGCLYLAHPYLLFTAVERTAYAELLAMAWLPWLLQEMLRERVSARRFAIPMALLWLTNTPSAVLATYTLAIVVVFRVVCYRRHGVLKPVLLPGVLGYFWGLALSALYLLPALVQHSAVQVEQAFTAGMMPEESTLFAHTGNVFHDRVVHQASVLAILLLGAAALVAAVLLVQHRRTRRLRSMRDLTLHSQQTPLLAPTMLVLTAVTAFLLTPASLPLWHHLPEMLFLQFPWRTLMLQGVATVTLIVLAVRTRVSYRVAVLVALSAAIVLSFAAHRSYAQFCDAQDGPASLQVQYRQGAGFEPYDEYTPKDADNDLIHQGEPAAWTTADPSALPIAKANGNSVTESSATPERLTVQVTSAPSDRFLILRQRAFRNWHISLDGVPVQQTIDRDDGLIAVPLSGPGPHTAILEYRWSADQVAGVLISAVAAFGLLGAFRTWKRRDRSS